MSRGKGGGVLNLEHSYAGGRGRERKEGGGRHGKEDGEGREGGLLP